MESVRSIKRNFWKHTSRDVIETVIVAGICDLRRLQIKRCGRLGPRAVLALDCCPNITRNDQVTNLAEYLSGKTNQYLWNYTTIMETVGTTDWKTLCFSALIATLLPRVIEERTKKKTTIASDNFHIAHCNTP